MGVMTAIPDQQIPLQRQQEPPAWVNSEQTCDSEYLDIWNRKGKGSGKQLDLYFDEGADLARPLVLFQHIQKTAGTSLRHLIYSNKGHASFELLRLHGKRDKDVAAAYESLGPRRDRLVGAAGHAANYLVPLVGERPVVAVTLVRDPVDHAVSTYHFSRKEKNRTFEEHYGLGGKPPMPKGSTSFNRQAQSLLAPDYGIRSLPLLPSHRDADLWRDRLFELVDRLYIVGLQERFLHSVALFAEKLGWATLYPASVRINWARPRDPLAPDLVDAIRRYNWLDEELYRRTCERFDREGPSWDAGGWM
jgi:hypothetical protein